MEVLIMEEDQVGILEVVVQGVTEHHGTLKLLVEEVHLKLLLQSRLVMRH